MSHAEMAERALVQSTLDRIGDQIEQAREGMKADLDRLAESWRSGFEERRAASEQRIAALREDQRTWLKDFIGGDAEGVPTGTHGRVGASTAERNAPASSGPGPGHPTLADELAEAERIRLMAMDQFIAERERLGIRSSASMSHLFRE